MGKGLGIEIEAEPSKSNVKEVLKVPKRANLIKKPIAVSLKNKQNGMEIETGKDKIKKKLQKVLNSSSRPTKKTSTQTQVTPKPEYKPQDFKEFDKIYEASKFGETISKNVNRGKKRRLLKKEKINKKHVIILYNYNLFYHIYNIAF